MLSRSNFSLLKSERRALTIDYCHSPSLSWQWLRMTLLLSHWLRLRVRVRLTVPLTWLRRGWLTQSLTETDTECGSDVSEWHSHSQPLTLTVRVTLTETDWLSQCQWLSVTVRVTLSLSVTEFDPLFDFDNDIDTPHWQQWVWFFVWV